MRGWTKVALGALTAIATLGLAPAASATTYYCHGLPATIVGTAGSNSIGSWRSPGPDVIVTLGGDDYVNAGDGDDTVCSGTGNDRVSGQIGADTILTGSGNDTVNGGPDYDTMWLGGGADANLEAGGLEGHTIYGGPGDDDLVAGDVGTSKLYGQDGNDTLQIHVPEVVELADGGPGVDHIDSRGCCDEDGYALTSEPDRVLGGIQPDGTRDVCITETTDVVTGCEAWTALEPEYA